MACDFFYGMSHCEIKCNINNRKYSNLYRMNDKCRQTIVSTDFAMQRK